jgi:hypothetical protein
MWAFTQSRYWPFTVLGALLPLLASASKDPTPSTWVWALVVMAIISLLAWISSIRRGNTIATLPTSAIASAAQGYVELKGQVSTKPNYRITARSGLACVWFRCITYRKDSDGWEVCDRSVSESIFEIDDGSGESCMVDPEHAEVVSSNRRTWYDGNTKYVEEQLFAGQTLYVLGDFSTLAADVGQTQLNTDVSLLLAEWKKDYPKLLARFDHNHDGQLDMTEWENVRQAAYQALGQQQREVAKLPAIHLIKRPKNGRLFLISNLPEHKLQRQSQHWAWLHLLLFFSSLAGVVWVTLQAGLL